MTRKTQEGWPSVDRRKSYRLLVIDPSPQLTGKLTRELGDPVRIDRAATADTALQMLGLNKFDLMVLQLKLPLFSGLELARRVKKLQPDLAVLPIAQPKMGGEADEIYRLGYPPPVIYPDEEAELMDRCREYIQAAEWHRRINRLKHDLKRNYGFDEILSVTPEIQSVHERLMRVVESRVPVLITGESGTGKELVARMIHRTGERSRRPFITVNCAAVPEGLLESQFFGHEKGAFTGAESQTPGKFELADNGTLFLDEIGEMSPALQSKFLRVLEHGEFERVGGIKTMHVDVRMITATNRNLEEMVEEGTFRADLLYRINVFPIHLPSLRERDQDVTLLAYHFLKLADHRNNRQVHYITPEALELLNSYPWPGNIRELENGIERALLLSDGVRLKPDDFPQQIESRNRQSRQTARAPQAADEDGRRQVRSLKEIEREAIQNALEVNSGNIALSARQLGISRNTLYRKIKELELRAYP